MKEISSDSEDEPGSENSFDGTLGRHQEILASFAHDLRSPLTSLRTGIEVLKLSPKDSGQMEKVIKMLERQTAEMSRLLDVMTAERVGVVPPAPAPALAPVPHVSPTPGESPGRKVLVVDDSRSAADIISLFFKLEGLHVDTAYFGEDAVNLAKDTEPHIVFLDLGLPDVSGYQVAQRLRQLPGGERLFLVAMTGRDAEEDREKIRQAGFDLHVVKPPEPATLRNVLSIAASKFCSDAGQ